MLISNSCYPRWTLVDDEGINLNTIPQGAFFELDIDGVTYYGISDFDAAHPATTLVARLYSDEQRSVEVVAGTFTGLPYVIRFFAGWLYDHGDQGSFGRWVSNEVTIYQTGGKWVGRWVATIDGAGFAAYSFAGEFILLPLSVFGLTATPVLDAGGALGAGDYCFRVSAVDSGGNEGPASPVVSATLSGQGDINLDWFPTPGAVSYRVYGRDCPCPSALLATPVVTEWEDDAGAGTPAIPPNDPDPDIEDDCPYIVLDNGDGTYSNLQDCDEDGCFTGTGPLGAPITVCLSDPAPPPDGGGPLDDSADDGDGTVVVIDNSDEDGPVVIIPIDPDGSPGDDITVIEDGLVCHYRRKGPLIDPDEWEFTAGAPTKQFTLTNAAGASAFSTNPTLFEITAQTDTTLDVQYNAPTVTGIAVAYNSYIGGSLQSFFSGTVPFEVDNPNFNGELVTARVNIYAILGNDTIGQLVWKLISPAGENNINPFLVNMVINDAAFVGSLLLWTEYVTSGIPGVILPVAESADIATITITNGFSTTELTLYAEAP